MGMIQPNLHGYGPVIRLVEKNVALGQKFSDIRLEKFFILFVYLGVVL